MKPTKISSEPYRHNDTTKIERNIFNVANEVFVIIKCNVDWRGRKVAIRCLSLLKMTSNFTHILTLGYW